ncbi:c-type cytochrome [Pelomonas sp. CA6]|uniref:c-type cytochrome n=1 Tax=Pelomonas sp. CA6 TaxID=2907999 RepID=UPI001F4C1C95|nr:c-type cytochrome [Pelomonas sp. CA6]MCH7344835.1 c-type cytochrome [Pelomonas sp. CA6]
MPPNPAKRLAAAVLLAGFGSAALAQAAPDVHPLLARNLAATCANCHGTQGASHGELPSLAGRDAAELQRLLAEFRSGARAGTIMPQIAKGYSEEQLRLIVGYFAAQPHPKR